jgi:biopolymer transport protein ExbB
MIESLKNLMVRSGSMWVLWSLIALSVVSLAIAIDRARYMFSRRENLERLTSDLNRMLASGDRPRARVLLRDSRGVEAAVVLAGLTQWEQGAASVTEAMAAATGIERARMERGLGFLGTVGNNAPFVGLLGTVIGVVGAFEALGQGGAGASLAPERVMGSIAEALVATAVGLVVAIPAVAGFNYFQGVLTRSIEGAETLSHILLSHLQASGAKTNAVAGSAPAKAPSEEASSVSLREAV